MAKHKESGIEAIGGAIGGLFGGGKKSPPKNYVDTPKPKAPPKPKPAAPTTTVTASPNNPGGSTAGAPSPWQQFAGGAGMPGTTAGLLSDATSQSIYGYSSDEANLSFNTGVTDPANNTPVWTVSNFMNFFNSMSGDQVAAMQKQLYGGGFYNGLLNSGQLPNYGSVGDADTMKAMMAAVRQTIRANYAWAISQAPRNADGSPGTDISKVDWSKAPVTLQQVLSQGSDGKGGQKATKPPRLSDPEITKANARAVALDILGTELTPGELNTLADQWEGEQQKMVDPNNPSSAYYLTGRQTDPQWLAQAIRNVNPTAAEAHNTSNLTSAFMNLLLQGPNSVPYVQGAPGMTGGTGG